MTDYHDLTDRVALVTGASRGIGAAVSIALAEAGAHVILAATDKSQLRKIQKTIIDQGGEATILPVDLSKRSQIEHMAEKIAKDFGKLDILVGNAGIEGDFLPLVDSDPDIWQKTMDVNLTANFHLIRNLHPLLEKSDAGRALFVTSGIVYFAGEGEAGPYCPSKAALEAMVKMYAAETEGTNINVNLIDPGEIKTDMMARLNPDSFKSLPSAESIAYAFLKHVLPQSNVHGKRLNAWNHPPPLPSVSSVKLVAKSIDGRNL